LGRGGINPNTADIDHGLTPLHWAVKNGHEGVVKILLKCEDVHPNAQDTKHGRTPLVWAVKQGHEGVVRLLLQRRDVDPNTADIEHGLTPLHWAANNGHEGVVKLLLEREDLIPIISSPAGQTAFQVAASQRHYRVMQLLSQVRMHLSVRVSSRGVCGCPVSESSVLLYCCPHHFSSDYSVPPRPLPHVPRKKVLIVLILSVIICAAVLSLVVYFE